MEKGALIGRGRTADVYGWGADRVIKLFAERMPGYLVEQEYRVTRAANAAALPVPAADGLVEVEGRHGILFERLEGPSMLRSLTKQPWKLAVFARQLAELQAKIHACADVADLPSQRQAIEKAIISAEELPQVDKEKVQICLDGLPEGVCLCHGDFHPDNILMTSRGPFAIDWMKGSRGNPFADVCCSTILFQTGGLPGNTPLHIRLLLKILRILLETTYIHRYLQIRPGSRRQIYDWQLPLMAARLREVRQYPDEMQQLLGKIRREISR